jgi:hypothetical protein
MPMNAELFMHMIDETKLLRRLTDLLSDAKDALREEPLFVNVAKHRIDYALSSIKAYLEERDSDANDGQYEINEARRMRLAADFAEED